MSISSYDAHFLNIEQNKYAAQSCLTLCNPMDYSVPPGQNTGVGSLSFLQGIFPIQGLNTWVLHCRLILYQLSYQGSPILKILIKIYLMLIIYSTPEITSLQFSIVKNFSHQLRDVLGILLLFTILLWSIKVKIHEGYQMKTLKLREKT